MTRTFTITQSGVARDFEIAPGGYVRTFTVNNGVGPQGATGATGPAGPNSVTSATSTNIAGILGGDGSNVYEFPSGTEPIYNEDTELFEESAALYGDEGQLTAEYFITSPNGLFFATGADGIDFAVISATTSPLSFRTNGKDYRFNAPSTGDGVQWDLPNLSGKFALTQTANGEPDKLTNGTISGTLTINSTSYTYGTGAASAHRAALGVAFTQLQTESLFSLLTLQESDAGVYTANAGSASGGADGDFISLSASTANQRPNVYRLRNWSRNPGNSGAANPVMPLKLASAGNIIHSGSGANGGSFRCGIGMVNGASAVAANANATTGRGFGWRIAWNSTTSKLEFNLWAHDGTTYVEGTGIDTGLGATNLDGFFNVIVCLASDGTVTANTWFGTNTSLSTPSATPTATLAGGPTSGTFANQGIPLWIAAAHSSTAPTGVNSIIAKIINRRLMVG